MLTRGPPHSEPGADADHETPACFLSELTQRLRQLLRLNFPSRRELLLVTRCRSKRITIGAQGIRDRPYLRKFCFEVRILFLW